MKEYILLVVLIVLSAFFAAAEIALFSLSRIRLRLLLKKGGKKANLVNRLKSNPQRLLVTILVGNNIVNIGASTLMTSIVFRYSQDYAVSIATGVMTLILLVFGEIIPKSYATRYNEQYSLIVARPLIIIQYMLFPLVIAFEKFARLFEGKEEDKPFITEEDIQSLVNIGEEIGQIEKLEKIMIDNVFRFNDVGVKDIMVKCSDVVNIDAKSTIREVAEKIRDTGHTKIPVIDKAKSSMIGLVHVLDVDRALLNFSMHDKNVKTIMRSVPEIESDETLDNVLRYFLNMKKHMAVVKDRKGKKIGIVTLEDVLEEIVGEIMEEHEKIG